MTAVPKSFQPEPGAQRCGNTFEDTITVTGELPNKNGFGSDRKHIIPRVALVPGGTWWSSKSQAEKTFRDQIVARSNYVAGEITEQSKHLTFNEVNSLRWLLALASANLDRVDAIYRYWDGHGAHPKTGEWLPADNNAPSPIGAGTYARRSEWPLTASDAIWQYMGECQGKNAAWVEDYEVGPNAVVTYVRLYFCPGDQTRARRTKDRKLIRTLLLDAARAVRCAQYGVWRLVLYKDALDEWNDRYGDLPGLALPTEPGIKPTPGIQGGTGSFGIYVEPIEPPGPGGGGKDPWGVGPVGPDLPPGPQLDPAWPVPDPDKLPDPAEPGEGEEEGEEEEGELGGGVGVPPPSEVPPPPSAPPPAPSTRVPAYIMGAGGVLMVLGLVAHAVARRSPSSAAFR